MLVREEVTLNEARCAYLLQELLPSQGAVAEYLQDLLCDGLLHKAAEALAAEARASHGVRPGRLRLAVELVDA